MADIIVQNAVKAVKAAIQDSATKLDYESILGSTLDVKIASLLVANVSKGPYAYSGAAATGYICDLSDLCKISHCSCNYSGSGTGSTAQSNTNNPWNNGTVLQGAGSRSFNDIITAIINTDSGLANLNSIAGVTLDIYLVYTGLKAKFTTDNNTSVLRNWYGVGIAAPQAAALSLTNKLKVCGTSWQSGQGATCTWTVPPGATRAKFQVWGAGQGSNPGCCCGGASFGESGAYAEMIITVTPGQQYSICAGCSCSRYCCSSETPGYGCMSGVTGAGIDCLKADGARCYQSNCDDMNAMRTNIGAGGVCHKFQNPYCTSSGPCWCSYGEYCFSNSCSTCGVVPVYPSCCDYNVGVSCATVAAKIADGPTLTHRGLHGGGCLDTDNYGYHIRPPIIDADTGLEFTGGCKVQTFTSGNSCGGVNGAGWAWHPGQGGAATHVMGGENNHRGDTGRGGMVQVSWI